MREHAEIGAVRQLAQYRQPAVALHADDQVGPGAGDAGHLRVPGEVPVGQHQHPGTEVPAVDELVQQQRLAGAHRRPGRVDQGPGAEAISASSPDLRRRPGPRIPGRIAETLGASPRVRDVQPGASAETFSRATSRPNAVIPGRRTAGTVPHSRPNSAFSGARPRRRRAWTAADTVGTPPAHPGLGPRAA